MKTIKIKASIQLNQIFPFVGCYEIQDENIDTFQDVKNLAVKWWREEKEKTWMPWGKLSYQTPKLTWCGKAIGPGKKVKLEETVLTNFVFVKAILRFTRKEKAKHRKISAKEREIKASKTNYCENMREVLTVRWKQHKKNIKKSEKKLKIRIKKKRLIYDERVVAAARDQGLHIIKVCFSILSDMIEI